MIKVTRLNDSELWINAELIQVIEATPDTVISLTTNDKIIVRESPEVLVRAVMEYRRNIFQSLPVIEN